MHSCECVCVRAICERANRGDKRSCIVVVVVFYRICQSRWSIYTMILINPLATDRYQFISF